MVLSYTNGLAVDVGRSHGIAATPRSGVTAAGASHSAAHCATSCRNTSTPATASRVHAEAGDIVFILKERMDNVDNKRSGNYVRNYDQVTYMGVQLVKRSI